MTRQRFTLVQDSFAKVAQQFKGKGKTAGQGAKLMVTLGVVLGATAYPEGRD